MAQRLTARDCESAAQDLTRKRVRLDLEAKKWASSTCRSVHKQGDGPAGDCSVAHKDHHQLDVRRGTGSHSVSNSTYNPRTRFWLGVCAVKTGSRAYRSCDSNLQLSLLDMQLLYMQFGTCACIIGASHYKTQKYIEAMGSLQCIHLSGASQE